MDCPQCGYCLDSYLEAEKREEKRRHKELESQFEKICRDPVSEQAREIKKARWKSASRSRILFFILFGCIFGVSMFNSTLSTKVSIIMFSFWVATLTFLCTATWSHITAEKKKNELFKKFIKQQTGGI